MKIFVTGATGFVGSHLCELLTKQGHEVYSLVRNLNKASEFNLPGTYIKGSLASSNSNEWIKDLPDDLECVVHTAGIVHSPNANDFQKINTDATEILFNDLKNKYQKLNFVFVSSLAASGPALNSIELKETDKENPVSLYGESKLNAEKYIKEKLPENWQLTILRPPMVIGPRDPAVLDVFKMVKQGIVLKAGANANAKEYSYICVYDLVKLITLAIKRETGNSKEVFFTSHPSSITMGELIEVIKSKMNKKRVLSLAMPLFIIKAIANLIGVLSKFIKIEFRLTPDKMKELVADAWLCSGEKSISELDMSYEWDFEKTIEETLLDYKSRGWI
jgi:nucleoside-diphosphate-sugar epimerase